MSRDESIMCLSVVTVEGDITFVEGDHFIFFESTRISGAETEHPSETSLGKGNSWSYRTY